MPSLAFKRCRFALVLLLFAVVVASRVSAQPYGLASRPQIGALLNNVMPEASPAVSGNWSAVVAFSNLTFVNAVGLCAVPGTSNLLCVWEREGRVYTFTNSPTVTQKKLVLNITNQCQGWDDSGLLGVAFHPNFASNGYMFVSYTWVTPGTVQGDPNTRPPTFTPNRDRLARFTLDTNGVAIPGSETVFIDQNADTVWHNGGGLFFHPSNGFLYLTDGDDENGGNTQRIDNNLFSGVLRLDVDQRGGGISHPPPRQPANGTTANYYIPNDNPFVGVTNALEEFFAIGLRSPHRMTIDPPSGRIFIGDVGAGEREEIDVIEPGDPFGLNFQWDRIEGLRGDLTPPYIGVNRRPILDYDHSQGQAVIGGYVYRGSEFAADLGGKYIFGDNVQKTIWALDESTLPAGKIPLCVLPTGTGPNSGSDYTGLSSFGLDQAGELYMCQLSSLGGKIYKLARSGPPPATRPMPTLLSQTGAFTNLLTLTAHPGLVPYAVNSPLWSDGAVKSRWLALPTNTTIGFAPTGEWAFPQGAVFVKHFELPVNENNPAIRRRLETRLLALDTNGTAYGVTYKWRADNSDADLVTNSLLENITITNTLGGLRTQQWFYPSRSDCLRCHTTAAGFVLGAKTRQQNGTFTYPATAVSDNQLRAWNHVGLFNPALNEAAIAGYAALVPVTNTAAPIEHRVRSYLDANCSHCHRPGGSPAQWDGRFDTPLADARIVNASVGNNLGISGAREVAPQSLARSIMHVRVNSLDPAIKMPPLARNVADTNALTALAEWINSLALPTNSLPPPWDHTDIGAVGYSGDAAHTNGTFAISGGGDDIWGNADAFHFAYQTLTGNGQIVARLATQPNTDGWTKSGVMIRETLDAGARHAFACVTPGNGAAFQRRTTTDGVSDHTPGAAVTAPYWVRVVRSNNTFTAYASATGTNWTAIDSVSMAMTSNVFIGLAVTAHNNGVVNTSTFDNVALAGGAQSATVTTLPASGVTRTNATLNGSVTTGSTSARAWFETGLTTSYGQTTADQLLPASNTSTNVSANFPGLAANTLYHYRVVASNAFGVTRGSDASFTTLAAPPTVATLSANGFATNGSLGLLTATLNATVNPNGPPASAFFELGLTTAYGTATLPLPMPAGSSPVAFSNVTAALAPGFTYHFRVVASNSGGTAFGGNVTFVVPSIYPRGDFNGDGIVSSGELNNVFSNYWSGQGFGLTNVAYPNETNFQFWLSNLSSLNLSVQVSTNRSTWQYLAPAQLFYQVTDPAATNTNRFYRLTVP